MAAGLPDIVFPVSIGESLLIDRGVFVFCVGPEDCLPDNKLTFTDCMNCHLHVYCPAVFFFSKRNIAP